MAAARELAGDHVVIVGGGNSAGQAAIHAARFASRVTILVRRPGLAETMSSYLIDEIEWNPRIEVRGSACVVDGGPDDVGHLAWLEVEDQLTGERDRVEARGLFLLLGAEPECSWLPEEVLRDAPASCSPAATCRASCGSTTSRPATSAPPSPRLRGR